MSSSFGRVAGVAILFLVALALPASATKISNLFPGWNGTSEVHSFGRPNTATYGQTLKVPVVDTQLNLFEFAADLPEEVPFRGFVSLWSGTKATGAALWQSVVQTPDTLPGFQTFSFSPNLNLTAGDTIVFFISTSDVPGQLGFSGKVGQPQNQDLYADGGFVFLNNAASTAAWTTDPWTTDFLGIGADLTFKAVWEAPGSGPNDPVPEPATYALVGSVLAGVIIYRRRR